eukprot:CAMPEP_0178950414 /NCGR_PEP_ID=MMETSP0789-20121207/6639_1 /TAXON_ID=3005 /ORGANISM="Rhizosolenia setigera, Strain CCMP 1694" /LENGTH=1268 /DNA_ID=CAMNT_0020631137 /DNA_START=75 /DNA_END=3882 /DNA_ORIENTATION=-
MVYFILVSIVASYFSFLNLPVASAYKGQCSPGLIPRPEQDKDIYKIGVLAIRGPDAARSEFGKTFGDYLTQTAGKRFDPPITFALEPLNFIQLFSYVEDGTIYIVNPSAYSCIESQYGAYSLVSQISRRKVGGEVHHLTKFGGVIFTLADSDVNSIEDIKGKSVAAASISGLGSGQMQFRVLQQAGLSYINDPKKVVFTSNQGVVVNGVLNGDFDVGFVRTDQLERTKDSTGELIDRSKLKIIDPRPGLHIDGKAFPFDSSTPLYPEWNVAALTSVPDTVATEVQKAMLELSEYADMKTDLDTCLSTCIFENNCDSCGTSLENNSTCNPTIDLVELAAEAKTNGKYSGWRTTLSYVELRNMQEETSFISRDAESGTFQCIRSSKIYDAIVCPPGHFKKSEYDVTYGCNNTGLTCDWKHQCVCTPCVKSFDVDVYPSLEPSSIGCAKFSVCGTTQQTKPIKFHAIDNKQRDNATVTVILHEGVSSKTFNGTLVANETYTYEFSIMLNTVGVAIFEVLVDGEQIPESPLRVQVKDRDCVVDESDIYSIPDVNGTCVCSANSIEINNQCVAMKVFLPSILAPSCLILIIALYLYVEFKTRKADSFWSVKTEELNFNDPPQIIGRGTFGLVLLAEYRGTQVAVKRVIPPRMKGDTKSSHKSSASSSNFLLKISNPKARLSASAEMRKRSSVQDAFDGKDVDLVTTSSNEEQKPPQVVFSGNDIESSAMENGEKKSTKVEFDEDAKKYGKTSGVMASGMSSGIMSSGMSSGFSIGLMSGTSSGLSSGMSSGATLSSRASSIISGSLSFLKNRDEYTILKNDFIKEMRHLSKLRHPCITTVMGAVINKKEEPMLVMEYMDHGSLYDVLHNETMIIEGEFVLPILRDIAQGVRFLHSATPQVIHGDLKAQNVLVDAKFRAKVADFGLSQKKEVGAAGTPLWMAPELLCGKAFNNSTTDVFSFGVILYEVYSRKDPYEGEDYKYLLRDICDPSINKRPEVPPAMPPVIANLMKECLDKDPSCRPSFDELDLRLKRFDVDTVEPGQMVLSRQTKNERLNVRSSMVLFDIFPKHIAKALQEGRRVEPESHDMITIFFSDIVGYTTLCSDLEPRKVADMIDRLYQKFDSLVKKHDIFKVETIGDAYLAAANLTSKQDDHAKRIAMFALDAVKEANETLIDVDEPSKGFISIRVGFHSGPVVTDVVGSTNPKFTLFGDTMNLGSRMESNSLPNHIQCSDKSAEILQEKHPDVRIECRGEIEVKGKGFMTTYFILPVEDSC